MAFVLVLHGFTLGIVAFLFAVAVAIGEFVFAPLRPNRSQAEAARWQFYLTDLLLLVTQLSLVAALIFRPDPEFGVGLELAGLLAVWAILATGWCLGVRSLSRARVREPLSRTLVLGVIVPLVYGWPVALCPVLFQALLITVFYPVLLIPALVVAVSCLYASRLAIKRVAERNARLSTDQPTVYGMPGQERIARTGAWCLCLVAAVAVMLGLTYPVALGVSTSEYYELKLVRFREDARTRLDVPRLQAWLADAKTTPPPLRSGGPGLEMPPELLNGLEVWCDLTPQGTLLMTTGSGFGHWGVEIAPPGAPMPQNNDRRYYLPLQDGAWVWHEIQ